MTFNQMRYFIAVADSLSFTDAAQSLFLTQPALSRQIAALEQELGTSLFIRNRNGLQLTPSGMLLYQKLPDMLRDLELLISQVQMSDKGFSGELNIGFLDIYDTSRYFTKIIQEFTTQYPDINLSMYYMSSDSLADSLRHKKLDLIVTYDFFLPQNPAFTSRNLHPTHSCLIVPKNSPLAELDRISINTLKEDSYILVHQRESEEGNRNLNTMFGRFNYHPVYKIVDKTEDMMLWMGVDKHLALTTDVTIDSNNPAVKVIPVKDVEAKNMVAAWRKDNYNPAIPLMLGLWDH